jgi:hypothetical protein
MSVANDGINQRPEEKKTPNTKINEQKSPAVKSKL